MSKLPEKVAAGDEIDVQLAPLGDWAQLVGGRRIVQRFDEQALSEVVENFRGEILVDADHRSTKPDGDTSAYAWVTALKADPERGLVGTMRFTDKGAAAVNAREYRFVSVSWYLSPDGRPRELDSVALTNRPNLPVRPVVNREGVTTQSSDGGASAENTKPKESPEMEELKTLLGLAADATDDQVVAAAKALKERLDAIEAQAKDAEAERFAAENSAKCDKATLKDAYLKSPEVAKALVANMKAPAAAPAAALPDFTKGRAPAPVANSAAPGMGEGPAEAYRHYAAMPEGPEKEAYLASNAQAISDGYEAVRNAR